jgi:hypothetical protein
MAKRKVLSAEKAKEILEHGEVHGKPLTPKQRRFMGARASGKPVKGKKKKSN